MLSGLLLNIRERVGRRITYRQRINFWGQLHTTFAYITMRDYGVLWSVRLVGLI